MDNSDSNQQNKGGSSNDDENDTNFITQQNYTIKKKTVRKTNKIKNNPLSIIKTIKSTQWKGDSFDNEMNDEEYIEQRKRDKVLKMIKNAHIEKRKNYIFLKEINNAHDQIQRFSQIGETAEAKEMERELNTLTKTVIQSNIDAFTKTKLAKTHASLYGQNYYNSNFKDKNSTKIRNLSKSERVINDQRIYNSTIKKTVNKNYEENEEIEETEEEEETKTRKREKNKNKDKDKKKNKTLVKNKKRKGNNSGRPFVNNISEFNKLFNNPNPSRSQYPNQIQNPNQSINGYPPNQFYNTFPNQNPNLQGAPNQFMGPYQNQNPNLLGYPSQFINNSQNPNQNPNLRGYPNQKINSYQNPNQSNPINSYTNPSQYLNENPNNLILNDPYYIKNSSLKTQMNEKYNVYNEIDQINRTINDYTTSQEMINKNKKKRSSNNDNPKLNNQPSQESQDKNDNDINIVDKDDFDEDETEKENNKEERKSPEQRQEEQKKIEDILLTKTISNTVLLRDHDIQTQLGPNQIPNQNNPGPAVEIQLDYPIPEEKKDSLKTIETILDNPPPMNPLQEKENPEIKRDSPEKLNKKINPNKKPNDRINSAPYSPEQNPELKAPFETGPQKRNPLFNPPYQNPSKYAPNQYYPSNKVEIPYPNNYPENPHINPSNPYPKQKPTRQRPKPKSPKKNYPKKKSPNNYPNIPFGPEKQYEDFPEEKLRKKNPNLTQPPQKQKMNRPKSSTGPIINPSIPFDNKYEYPRRYRNPPYNPGRSLSRSKSRSFPKEERKSPSTVNIPFAYPTSGKCFACDVKCSISRSGNSPNKYVPYFASYKKLRKDVTYYDGEKYGYYQYASRFPENDEIFNINNY